MIWINSISELNYLTQSPLADCYCDLLIEPSDLLLQAEMAIPYSPRSQWTLQVWLLDSSGETIIDEISDIFEWYVFFSPNGNYYLNIRALRINGQMCQLGCFILHVVISRTESYYDSNLVLNEANIIRFDKYTDRYCIDSCCTVLPSDITFQQTFD